MSKTIESLKNGNYSVVDNQGVSVTEHFIDCLEKELADLETKLAESEIRSKESEIFYKREINRRDTKLRNIKQQLAEKEETIIFADKTIKGLTLNHNQDKISFAVAELEKLKHSIWTDQQDDGWLDEHVDIYFLTETIDNQIKRLRGNK